MFHQQTNSRTWIWITSFLWLASTTPAWAGEADQLFTQNQAAIFQVRVVDTAANNKSSTGTGFVVASTGLLATNYHVIASAIDAPDKYRIELVLPDRSFAAAQIVNVDIVNDLALLQVDPAHLADSPMAPLVLASRESDKGETVYSIGFPFDLGITVIDGTYNGLAPYSVSQRVHFSGSLNPGMSGGPAFNGEGQVIGVNVSTAGNQMSFLVPVENLARLLATPRVANVADIPALLTKQLTQNSQRLVGEMLDGDWTTEPLAGARALGEITPFLRCWGNSKDTRDKSDRRPFYVTRACQTDHNIYVNRHLMTGSMEQQFYWVESDDFNTIQFYEYYQRIFAAYRPGNFGTVKDLGNWDCEENVIQANNIEKERTKAIFCLRAYKKFPGLYDVLFVQGSIDRASQGFVTHFTLAGTTREMAMAFTSRFMEADVW
ncbi:MAG: serine protease Do [Candidatus Paceibacteria bacterium]|jgi:serine protease Do